MTKNLLHCLDSQSSVQIHYQLSTTEIIHQLLSTESYEVRWETLEYLLKFGKYRDICCDEDLEEESSRLVQILKIFMVNYMNAP